MRRTWGVPLAACLALAAIIVVPGDAVACSPPFGQSISGLGPERVVVVGSIGRAVPGGRLFHVERWFGGGTAITPIVIAFKEGAGLGDCSYPVTEGQRLLIAPERAADGRLTADLATLQADPGSADGVAIVREAEARYGPGVVPQPPDDGAELVSTAMPPWAVVAIATVLAIGAIGAAFWLFGRLGRPVAGDGGVRARHDGR